MRKFSYTSNKKGVDAKFHPSDVLLGEFAQAKGVSKYYQVSQKAMAIYTVTEWNAEWKKVMVYKAAYKKRMIAQSQLVLATRAKMMKQSKLIMVDKTFHFTIPMAWSIYNEYRRVEDPRFHIN